jgi:hypothetical protein
VFTQLFLIYQLLKEVWLRTVDSETEFFQRLEALGQPIGFIAEEAGLRERLILEIIVNINLPQHV